MSVRIADCRWCGARIEQLPGGAWADDAGFVNCAKYRHHWPIEPAAIPLGPSEGKP